MDLTAFPEEERDQVLEIKLNEVCKCGYKRKDHKGFIKCPHYDGKKTAIMPMSYTGKFMYSGYYNYE